MKKYLKCICIVFIICILSIVGFKVFEFYNLKNKYYSREILETKLNYNIDTHEVSENFIIKDGFVARLINCDLNSIEEDNEIKLTFDFLRNDDSKVSNVIPKIIIYDNEKNILWSDIAEKEYNYYRKWFANDFYNEPNYLIFNQKILIGKNQYGFQKSNNIDEEGRFLGKNIIFGVPDDYSIPSSITVLFVNLKYQIVGNADYKEFENTDFKFDISIKDNYNNKS